eukprot:5895939-Pleurochrysis_carterae.AAC.1
MNFTVDIVHSALLHIDLKVPAHRARIFLFPVSEACTSLSPTVTRRYAALSSARQLEALRPAPVGCRKAILATNIAETSLTIDGVVYVVDAGLVKTKASGAH